MKKSSRKKLTLIISFSCAVFIALTFSAISGYSIATKYKQNLESVYTRALNELTDYLDNIEHSLNKLLYSNTSSKQNSLLSQLSTESNSAKTALAELPIEKTSLDGINRFLSQTGNYSAYLSKSVLPERTLSSNEKDNLSSLEAYAKEICSALRSSTVSFHDGNIAIGKSLTVSNLNLNSTSDDFGFSDNFKNLEENFTNYPTLIYDGPFSDHIMQRSPQYLNGKDAVSIEEAQQIAADFINRQKETVKYVEECYGNLPTHKFSCDNIEVTITKIGGVVNYMLNSTSPKSTSISFEEAKNISNTFLNNKGFQSMSEKYYEINNNICTINYAYMQNDIACYSDLIKVGIALDTGEIISFQATGFIMNHKNRPDKIPQLSKEEAMKSVSPDLKITNYDLVYSPTTGLNEVMCYEFECKTPLDETLLVYVNANTGMEEEIFTVITSENGKLVF